MIMTTDICDKTFFDMNFQKVIQLSNIVKDFRISSRAFINTAKRPQSETLKWFRSLTAESKQKRHAMLKF